MTSNIDYQPINEVDLQDGVPYRIVLSRSLPQGDRDAVEVIEAAKSPAFFNKEKRYWMYGNGQTIEGDVVGIERS